MNHPNKELVNYLLDGIYFGFDIGYRGSITPGTSRNLQSALLHPVQVSEALNKEIDHGHTLGPFHTPPFPTLHISPLGAIPKKNASYRHILDFFFFSFFF